MAERERSKIYEIRTGIHAPWVYDCAGRMPPGQPARGQRSNHGNSRATDKNELTIRAITEAAIGGGEL